jgi:hypothetical protein
VNEYPDCDPADLKGDVIEDLEATDANGDEVAASDTDLEGVEEVFVLEEAPDPDSVLPVWEPTGHAEVDAALERLHELTGTDVADHAAVFEQVEASLRATLDGLAAEDD